MHLEGDQEGIAVLKAMSSDNKEFLKFLIQEAKTVFEHYADFKSKDGAHKYRLAFDPHTSKFLVSKL